MLTSISITGPRHDAKDDIHRYARRKIGRLDFYLSRKDRESAHAEVRLMTSRAGDKKESTCEAVLHLPHRRLAVKESTLNMFASVDIVAAKLKNQLLEDGNYGRRAPAALRRVLHKLRNR